MRIADVYRPYRDMEGMSIDGSVPIQGLPSTYNVSERNKSFPKKTLQYSFFEGDSGSFSIFENYETRLLVDECGAGSVVGVLCLSPIDYEVVSFYSSRVENCTIQQLCSMFANLRSGCFVSDEGIQLVTGDNILFASPQQDQSEGKIKPTFSCIQISHQDPTLAQYHEDPKISTQNNSEGYSIFFQKTAYAWLIKEDLKQSYGMRFEAEGEASMLSNDHKVIMSTLRKMYDEDEQIDFEDLSSIISLEVYYSIPQL